MSDCVVCGAATSVTASCPHCADPVCAEHRSPASHDCAGVDADHTGGWVVDLDGSQPRADSPSAWWTALRPSRSGAWLAAGTLFLLVVAVVAVGVVGPNGPDGAVVASADGGGDRPNETLVEQRIATRTNEERRRAGLDPLSYDATLARVGAAHSADMRDRGFVGHVDPDGDGLRERYAEADLSCPGGENVYHSPNGALAASPDALADHVVRAWMDSEGHREAILRKRFTRQGVGVAFGPESGVYVTQDFC